MRFIKRQPQLEKAFRDILCEIDSITKPLVSIGESLRRIEALDIPDQLQPRAAVVLDDFAKGIREYTVKAATAYGESLVFVTNLEKQITETSKA